MSCAPSTGNSISYARVAVPVPARAGSLFSYSIPMSMDVERGALVVVPFASRILPGIVAGIDSVFPNIPTRELLGPVLGAPRIATERVEVALWMASHYHCSPFDALSLFLPHGWQRAVQERPASAPELIGWEFQWPRRPLSEDDVVGLIDSAAGEVAAGGVRGRVVAFLQSRGTTTVRDVMAKTGVALVTLKRMVKEGVLRELPLPMGEGAYSPLPASGRGAWGVSSSVPIILTDAQSTAYSAIAEDVERRRHRVTLLHGVTGSGKTHIYLKLIETLVRADRRAIVLVSEIAQTPEAMNRYSERFPGRVALMHSALPDFERRRLWQGVYRGQFDVVVGPRSALFAPVPQLGLVVLDEEHEPTYKQEELDPQYHARDVAIELGRRMEAAVVLGSATPDVASYYLAQRGVYKLQTLPSRYEGPRVWGWSTGTMPRVEIVDLRDELKSGNTGLFSRSLLAALEASLAAREQAILFLNRRGSSTSVLCRDCGHVLKCRRCDVPLVYHREPGELVCHQCNRRGPLPAKCPRCKGKRISFFGAGTERVEEDVHRLFPAARVLRWDHDVAGQPGAHERLHQQFRDHQADVLVGTQMVAKALDFPLVTLVGVVLADVTLHLPDFRAAERTFQLLAQVAGRAGRGSAEGKVIFQTYSPHHYSIVAAGHHDYRSFYEQELAFRRYHSYPPFRRMARLLFSGSGEARARYEALQMRNILQVKVDEMGIGDLELLGPAPAFHYRLRGRYRWQIVLMGAGLDRLLDRVSLPLGWSLDVDPVSLL